MDIGGAYVAPLQNAKALQGFIYHSVDRPYICDCLKSQKSET